MSEQNVSQQDVPDRVTATDSAVQLLTKLSELHGGLMIHQDTWVAMGGTEFASMPSQASQSAQIIVAERIRAATGGGYSAWPGCQRKLGLP